MKDEGKDEKSEPTNRKIDVEAPSPRHFGCESSAHQRPYDGRDAKNCAHESREYRSFVQGYQIHDNDHCSREDARGASTSYRAANDEGNRGGSSPTYCGPDFKENDTGQEDPFGVVESVDSAHDELERASGEHVGAAVPAHVVEGVKLISDGRNGSDNDCTVLSSGQA